MFLDESPFNVYPNSIAAFELINFFSWPIAILTRVISAKKTEAVSFFSKIKFAKSELPTAFLIPWSRYKFSTFSGDCSSLISFEDWISAITSLIKSLMKCQPILPALSDYNDQNMSIEKNTNPKVGIFISGGPTRTWTWDQRIPVCVIFTTPWTMPSSYWLLNLDGCRLVSTPSTALSRWSLARR